MGAVPWALLSALGFSTMALLMKRLAEQYPQWEIIFFRASINCAIVLGAMLARRQTLFPPQHRRLLLFRGVMGTASLVCYVEAVYRLPLSIASVLNQSTPIFVILVSWLAIGEKLRGLQIGWIGVAVGAASILIDPALMLPNSAPLAVPLTGALFALAGAACSGMTFVAIRAVSQKVSANTIILHFTTIATLVSAPQAWRVFRTPDTADTLTLIAMGLCASVGQYAMTRAYALAPAGLVASLGLTGAAFSTFYGIAFFGEKLAWLQWGAMVVLAAALLSVNLMQKSR